MHFTSILLVALFGCMASAEQTSPLLMWSNRAGLVGRKGEGAQVEYSAIAGDTRGSIVDSIKALMGKASDSSPFLALSSSDAAPKHISVVVFVGSHLDAAAMRKGAKSLSSVLDSSAASLSMPYASCKHNDVSSSASLARSNQAHGATSTQDASKSLSSSLVAAGISFKVRFHYESALPSHRQPLTLTSHADRGL
jgi:hypothetical protein